MNSHRGLGRPGQGEEEAAGLLLGGEDEDETELSSPPRFILPSSPAPLLPLPSSPPLLILPSSPPTPRLVLPSGGGGMSARSSRPPLSTPLFLPSSALRGVWVREIHTSPGASWLQDRLYLQHRVGVRARNWVKVGVGVRIRIRVRVRVRVRVSCIPVVTWPC